MKKTIYIILCILSVCAPALAADGTSLSGTLYVYPRWEYVKTDGVAVVTAAFPNKLIEQAISNGTNANQMTHLMVESGSLTNFQGVTYSLLTATNAFGDAISFSRVNFIAMKAGAGNTYHLNALDLVEYGVEIVGGNEPVYLQPGGCFFAWAPDSSGYRVATNAHRIYIYNSAPEPDMLYASPGLSIDSGVDQAFQTTNAVTWAMNNKFWSLSATTNLTFSNADTINVGTNDGTFYGVWRIQADTNGTVSTVAPATNQVYTTSTGAVAALPAASANNIGLGYVVVSAPTGTAFVANTTSLTTNNATFTDATPGTPAVQTYELYIGGVAE